MIFIDFFFFFFFLGGGGSQLNPTILGGHSRVCF